MKNTKKESRNSRGLSLIEIVIALSIMGVISAGIGTAMLQMSNSQQKIQNKVELNDTLSSLSDYIGTNDFCTKALIGKTVGSGLKLVVSNFKGIGGGTNIQAGALISSHIRLDQLNAYVNPNVSTVSTLYKGSAAQEVVLDVVVNTSRLDPGANEATWVPSPERRIAVPVKMISGKVVSCNHLDDEESSCTAIGGTWDSTNKKCKPNAMCENKGTYISWSCAADKSVAQGYYNKYGPSCGITIRNLSPAGMPYINSSPAKNIMGGIKNTFTNGLGCPSGSTKFHTGIDKHTYPGLDCGKKCTFNYHQTTNFYTCMKCS